MKQSMNTPYICKYRSNGELLNPIDKHEPYITYAPNRKQRRESLNQPAFVNNRAGVHLTVTPTAKYFRKVQRQITPDGRKVTIFHYLPA